MSERRRVAVVGYPAVELLDIACVTSTLQLANWAHGSAVSDVVVASAAGAPILCGTGLTLQAQATLERLRGPLDALIIAGGLGLYRRVRARRDRNSGWQTCRDALVSCVGDRGGPPGGHDRPGADLHPRG